MVNQRPVASSAERARHLPVAAVAAGRASRRSVPTLFYGSNNAGAVSVNGGRGRSNNFSVNGGDANDQFVNLPRCSPRPTAFEEFRVLTNTFDAEYGRNSGAVVNVVTKSGHQQLSRQRVRVLPQQSAECERLLLRLTEPKPHFKQNQFGGTFGGPIKKDRTFFFRVLRRSPHPPGSAFAGRDRAFGAGTSERNPGVFGDFSAESPFSGTLTNAFALNQRRNCTTALRRGAQYHLTASCIPTLFPGNIIPWRCMDPTCRRSASVRSHSHQLAIRFQTVPGQPERADQFTVKFDHRINEKQNSQRLLLFRRSPSSVPVRTVPGCRRQRARFCAYHESVSSNGTSATPGRSATT